MFTIDPENNITAVDSLQEIEKNVEGTETFSSAEDLTILATKWRGVRLVRIWNSLPGVEPVRRFTNRKTAVGRIWKAVLHLQSSGTDRGKEEGQAKPKKKAVRTARPGMRKTSKTARVIALLRQPRECQPEHDHACDGVACP
jgi:hypothetical protein